MVILSGPLMGLARARATSKTPRNVLFRRIGGSRKSNSPGIPEELGVAVWGGSSESRAQYRPISSSVSVQFRRNMACRTRTRALLGEAQPPPGVPVIIYSCPLLSKSHSMKPVVLAPQIAGPLMVKFIRLLSADIFRRPCCELASLFRTMGCDMLLLVWVESQMVYKAIKPPRVNSVAAAPPGGSSSARARTAPPLHFQTVLITSPSSPCVS